jgi:peroxiredoxin
MAIQAGDKMPLGVFGVMTEAGAGAISTDELFAAKKVVLVSVPGAFTPTCSGQHLPGFLQRRDDFDSKNVDTVAFMAVNDVHVMHAWGEDQGVGDRIAMLADGNAEYVKELGLEVDLSIGGMGLRGQRFAIIVDDGVATKIMIEEPRKFEVSTAESVLEAL